MNANFPRTDTMLLLSEVAQRASETIFAVHSVILSNQIDEEQNLAELDESISCLSSALNQLQRRVRDARMALDNGA